MDGGTLLMVSSSALAVNHCVELPKTKHLKVASFDVAVPLYRLSDRKEKNKSVNKNYLMESLA